MNAPYEIRLIGDPVLRQRAGDVTDIDGKLAQLADDMLSTMYDAPGAEVVVVAYVSQPIPSLSASKLCGSDPTTAKLSYGTSSQFRSGGGGGMQTVG